MKKFELTTEFITNMFGKKLFRIKALVEFGNVKAGDLEGFRKQVKETRNGKIAKEYLMIADLMEYHFTSEDSSNE